jgi:hypothetical protein
MSNETVGLVSALSESNPRIAGQPETYDPIIR